jgi:hypothetical protein
MVFKQVWLICTVLMLLAPACKKEDHDPPSVALSQPDEGFSIIADHPFTIAGRAFDDQGLTGITAILYHSVTEVIVQTESITIDGLERDFSFTMPAGDRYTETGEYTLQVTARDAAENKGSAFIQIHVQELPLEYRGVVWAGENTSNQYAVYKRDTAAILTAGPSGLNDMTGLLMDSRNDQVVATLSGEGKLLGWDVEDFSPLFTVDLPQGIGTETFSGISMNAGAYYAALREPAYLRSYRFDGAPVNNFDDVLHPATAVMATADRIYLGVAGFQGTPMKVDAYDPVGEGLLSTQVLDWEVERILPLDADHILVCGNEGGLGRIYVLDRQSLVRVETLDLMEGFRDAATANGRAWLLMDTGLYEFYPATGTCSAILAPGDYQALAVDATQIRLFLGGQDVVEVRTGAGAFVEEVTGGFGQVEFIRVHYNK